MSPVVALRLAGGGGVGKPPVKGPAGSGEGMSPGRDRLGPEKPSVRLCWQGGRQRLRLSAHRLGPPPGQGMPTRPGCAVPSTSVPSACKATIAFVRRSFVSGSHRGPPSPCPLDSAALRPQGHSHGVQLSLPLSKVHRPPRHVPAAPASSAPEQGGEKPLPLPGLPRGDPWLCPRSLSSRGTLLALGCTPGRRGPGHSRLIPG